MSFDFSSLTTKLASSGMLNPQFTQEVLGKVSQVVPPSPRQTTSSRPASRKDKGLPSDFPFYSLIVKDLFEDEDPTFKPTFKDFANLVALPIPNASKKLNPVDVMKGLKNAINNLASFDIDNLSPLLIGIQPKKITAEMYHSNKVMMFYFQGETDIQSPSPSYSIHVKLIKGGARIKVYRGRYKTDKFRIKEIETIVLPKTIYDTDADTVLAQIFNLSLNAIWNCTAKPPVGNQKTIREAFFNVQAVLNTLVGRSSLLDDQDDLNEVVASRIADNLVLPQGTLDYSQLNQLSFGTVLNVGDYILAKYESGLGSALYNIIDLQTGNYTDKAFDLKNLTLYGQSKQVFPKMIIDPNSNADVLSIISKYNMLYPSNLLDKALTNFQFDKITSVEKINPKLTYALGQEISELKQVLYVDVPTQIPVYIIDENGQKYRVQQSSSQAENKVYLESANSSSTKSIPYSDLVNLFLKHNFKWLVLQGVQIFPQNDMSKVHDYYATNRIISTMFELQGSTDDLISQHAMHLKNQPIWSRHGASINLIIGGYGAYAILIDKQADGTPFYMLQYLKQNTTVFRMVLSNQIDSANGEPYWVNYSTEVGSVRTATSQDSVGNSLIPYNPKYAMPTIDDAIEMIVTHLLQTSKTGFTMWKQANADQKPSVQPVVEAYYMGSAKNWSSQSVTIPSLLKGIVCGAMLVIPKGVGSSPKVFFIQNNNQWSIPVMNLTVGEQIESCAMDAMKSIFAEIPKDVEFSGATLSSTNKKDSSKTFHTVIFQVSEQNAESWTPIVQKGVRLTGYAWVDVSELDDTGMGGDIQWKPTILDELVGGQDFQDRKRKSFNSVLGAWIKHSDQWKQSAPIDPRLQKLIDPINLEQIQNLQGLYFDGLQYPFSSPPSSLFIAPKMGSQIPIEQRIAGFDGYKSNPRKKVQSSTKMVGYRRNGLGSVFRYQDVSKNHIIRLNPRRKTYLGIHDNALKPYMPVVEQVLGVKNPSRDLLESAYALEQIGLPLQDARRNPKDNSVVKLSLDDVKAVVQFADMVKIASQNSQLSSNISSKQSNRTSTGGYDSENYSTNPNSLPQWARYIPLFRVLGLWKKTLDVGERVLLRTMNSPTNTLMGDGKKSIKANEWTYAQLEHLKQSFPKEVLSLNISNDLNEPSNFIKMSSLWLDVQSGKYGKMFIRKSTQPVWKLVPYEEPPLINQNKLQTLNNTYSQIPKEVPTETVDNPAYHVEGVWVDYFAYTYDTKTHTGFSSFVDWYFGSTNPPVRLRTNSRDPRFCNLPGQSSKGVSFGGFKTSEREVMFVYPDKTALTCQLVNVKDLSGNTHKLNQSQILAWTYARPPYRKEPYPKGKFSDFIKKI